MEKIMSFIPYVIEKTSAGERSYDLYSLLLKSRVVFVGGTIEGAMAQSICAQLLFLESEKSDAPVNFYINSGGGSVTAGLSIVDTMNFISCPVYTTILGLAASMGSFIASQGEPGHRYALPNAEIMCHQPSGGTGAGSTQATDILIIAENIQKIKRKLTQGYADRSCGKKTYQQFYDAMERDRYMEPAEALEWGLIDKILAKRTDAL
jgi:ATP-dependent Clp protease protease subunit